MYKNIYELIKEGKLVYSKDDNIRALAEEAFQEPIDITPDNGEDKPESIEEAKPVEKIQTLDIVNSAMAKFETYLTDCGAPFDLMIKNGKISSAKYFPYADDMYTLLNKTFDAKKMEFVAIFNKFFENMTDTAYAKNLAIFCHEKYGKPFLGDGLALLLYELCVDWGVFLARYFKEMPDLENEQDSFVKKFPNLRLYTYFAKLFNDSSEFGKLITDEKSRELIVDDTKFKLTADQAKEKPNLYRASSESLSYYAALVRDNYADIMVGAIDKLGVVAYMTSKMNDNLEQRLDIIRSLIQTVASKTISPTNNTNDARTNFDAVMATLNQKALDLLTARSQARILLESNEKNFPMVL